MLHAFVCTALYNVVVEALIQEICFKTVSNITYQRLINDLLFGKDLRTIFFH